MSDDSTELVCKRIQRYLDRGLFMGSTAFAQHEGVSVDTVKRRATAGELPHVRTPLGNLYPAAATSRKPVP